MKKIAMVTIGSEILDGRTINTNASWLGEQLRQIGQNLVYVISCADHTNEIIGVLNFLSGQDIDLVVVSGGLGPTEDDLTREAVSEFCACELGLNSQVLEQLRQHYTARVGSFPQANEKQAMFPAESEIIENPIGTAAGFSITKDQTTFYCLPGVPRELKLMFGQSILPGLKSQAADYADQVFNYFAVPESALSDRIKALNLASEVEVISQTHYPVNRVVLRGRNPGILKGAADALASVSSKQELYGRDYQSLPEIVIKSLIRQNKTVSTAESCTGGQLSALLTAIPGSSAAFVGGLISYANQIKTSELQIAAETIEQFGAVSAEVAELMANNLRLKFGTDFALSVTGIAGPGGGSEAKPVGTVFVGLSNNSETKSFALKAPLLLRDQVQSYSCFYALNQLRLLIDA